MQFLITSLCPHAKYAYTYAYAHAERTVSGIQSHTYSHAYKNTDWTGSGVQTNVPYIHTHTHTKTQSGQGAGFKRDASALAHTTERLLVVSDRIWLGRRLFELHLALTLYEFDTFFKLYFRCVCLCVSLCVCVCGCGCGCGYGWVGGIRCNRRGVCGMHAAEGVCALASHTHRI